MSVDRTIAGVLFDIGAADARTTAYEYADEVLAAIRGMSHDELRQLRPDIAILFDATQDTANTRGDYIINLIVGRLRAVEQLHTGVDTPTYCAHDGHPWPCPTTRAVRGQS